MEGQPEPIDGESILPIIFGNQKKRSQPIGFELQGQIGLLDNKYKLISPDEGENFELYDIVSDPQEKNNISDEHSEIVEEMKESLEEWRRSCEKSLNGEDYQ